MNSDQPKSPPALSVVVPFYNEEHSIPALLGEVQAVAARWVGDVEIVVVDDGSADGTLRALQAAASRWDNVRIFSLARNCGQATALWYGFRMARGQIIGTLDGDGQNVPADFLRMAPVLATADLVVGIRKDRNDSLLRKIMSRIANAVRRRWLRDQVRDSGCAIKLFRREVAESFLPIRSLYSFIPAFAASRGFRIAELPVQHRPRIAGVSKYGLRAMLWRPALDMIAIGWMLRRRLELAPCRPIQPINPDGMPPPSRWSPLLRRGKMSRAFHDSLREALGNFLRRLGLMRN